MRFQPHLARDNVAGINAEDVLKKKGMEGINVEGIGKRRVGTDIKCRRCAERGEGGNNIEGRERRR